MSLRQLAAEKLCSEKPGQTLQATALVHEAYLRLVGVEESRHWNNRMHFFAAASEAMRRILVEQARSQARARSVAETETDLDLDMAGLLAPEVSDESG